MSYLVTEFKGVNNSIAIVSINRPRVNNALNSDLINELRGKLKEIEINQTVRVVIIKGSGDHFAAGADIREMMDVNEQDALKISKNIHNLLDDITQLSIPVIAAIRGYCLGGGLELALACDLRFAEEGTKMGLPEVKLGILPGGGGTQRVMDLAGPSVATHLILTGETIDAKRALSLNLVNEVCVDAYESALKTAEQLAQNSTFATSAIKRLLSGLKTKQLGAALETEQLEFARLFSHGEANEGLTAFIEKRKPLFK